MAGKIPSTGIADILVAANIGIAISPASGNNWPLFEGEMGSVDRAIMVRENGGRTPEVRIAINYPTVQVLVRGTRSDYAVAREKAEEVFLALQAIPSGPAEWPELTSCCAVGGVTFAGRDEQERPVWSLNFNLITSKDPEGHRDL
jgi:hypothetical protein